MGLFTSSRIFPGIGIYKSTIECKGTTTYYECASVYNDCNPLSIKCEGRHIYMTKKSITIDNEKVIPITEYNRLYWIRYGDLYMGYIDDEYKASDDQGWTLLASLRRDIPKMMIFDYNDITVICI